MKAKKRARLERVIDQRVRGVLEQSRTGPPFHVLSIAFENRSVDIPYQPWTPRQKVSLPGRWLNNEEEWKADE